MSVGWSLDDWGVNWAHLHFTLWFNFYVSAFIVKLCFLLDHQTLCNPGMQSKNNAYHNVNKVQNQGIFEWILNLIDIVVCVVFALYSRIFFQKWLFLNIFHFFQGIAMECCKFSSTQKISFWRKILLFRDKNLFQPPKISITKCQFSRF